MFYSQRTVDSYIAKNLYGGVGNNMPGYTEKYKGLKYFDIEKMAYLAPCSPEDVAL